MKTKEMLGMALLGLALMAAQPQDAKKAQGLMQAAQAKETISGDLKAAIDLYRQAARGAGSDRAMAAQALLKVAACQEKLGAAEAKKTYEEIVRSYADQKEAAAVARQKLGGAVGGELVARKVWDGPQFGRAGGVSPDGRYWSYISQNNYSLMIFDMQTGEQKVLFDGSTYQSPHFSPDGRRVAFGIDEGKATFDLAVKGVQGSSAMVRRAMPFRNWRLAGWFPDNDQLLILGAGDSPIREMSVASVRVSNGDTKEICRIPAGELLNDMRALVSGDGRYVVFDKKHSTEEAERDVFVVSAGGGQAQPLIADPSDDGVVAFTPDGQYLVFRSSRSQKPGLYAVRFADGRLVGEPRLASGAVSADRGGWFDQKGNFYYETQTGGETQQHVASIDLATGRATSPLRVLPLARGSGETPMANWTPDSSSIVLQRFGAGRSVELAIVDADSGREKLGFQTKLPTAYGVYMRPDGSTVVGIPKAGQFGYGNVDWEKRTVAQSSLTEGKLPDSVCGGPTVLTTTSPKGIRINDFSTNRTWILQERTDLPETSTIASATPDCRHLVHLSQPDARAVIYTDLTSGQSRELVRAPAGYRAINFPRLSPDGKRVVFILVKVDSRVRELWSIPASGGVASPTGIELVNMRNPRFSPDGKRLLLSGGQYNFEAYKVENLLPASLRAGK